MRAAPSSLDCRYLRQMPRPRCSCEAQRGKCGRQSCRSGHCDGRRNRPRFECRQSLGRFSARQAGLSGRESRPAQKGQRPQRRMRRDPTALPASSSRITPDRAWHACRSAGRTRGRRPEAGPLPESKPEMERRSTANRRMRRRSRPVVSPPNQPVREPEFQPHAPRRDSVTRPPGRTHVPSRRSTARSFPTKRISQVQPFPS